MSEAPTILEHRVLLTGGGSAKLHPTVIMVHGRGADEEDLVGLAEYYDRRLLVLSVRAPFPFPYGGGFTWYYVWNVGTPDPAMFR